MNYRDNLSTKFAASLQCGFGESALTKVAEFTSSDEMIKLAAGYTITDLSYDGICKFVSELFDRELHGILETKPHFTVTLTSASHSELGMGIENAEGIIDIELPNSTNLQIPFMVAKGELVPFDVMQLGQERCPYTRENLAKVITNILKRSTEESVSSSGYVSLEARQNPSTTGGFLTNMLQIRSRGSIIPDAGGMFVTASEKGWEHIMDKLGAMKPMDWEKVEKVASIIADRDREKMIKKFSDLGAESAEMVKTAATQSALAKSQPWKRLSEIPDGTFVKIPEKNAKEFSMTPAYVIRKFDNSMFDSSSNKSTWGEGSILVITADHRFMFVPKTSKIICIEAQTPLFALKANRLKEAKEKDIILFKTNSKKYMYPIRVVGRVHKGVNMGYTSGDSGNNFGHPATNERERYIAQRTDVYAEYLSVQLMSERATDIYLRGEIEKGINGYYQREIVLTKHPKFKTFKRVPFDIACRAVGADNATDSDRVKFLIESCQAQNGDIYLASDEKKCIILGGTFGRTFESFDELENIMSLPMEKLASEVDLSELMKTASEGEMVTVTKMNGAFNVKVKYNEKDEDTVVSREQRLAGINESAVMGALLGFGFDRDTAQNIIVKASNQGSVTTLLPAKNGAAGIFGSRVKKIKRMVEKVKNSDTAHQILRVAGPIFAAQLGNMAVEGIAEYAGKKIVTSTALKHNKPFINFMFGKMASEVAEASALSVMFEKAAIANEDVGYRKIAKTLGTASMFMDGCMKCIDSPESYPAFDKIAAEVVSKKEDIEGMISGLIFEKTASFVDGDFKINPSYYTRAIRQMNNMYEIASGVVDR
jgi:hypothetical protein